MTKKLPPRPPIWLKKKPPAPLMKIARPGMEELITRIQNLEQNIAKQKLLEKAKAWPKFVAGRPKAEIKQIRQEAGEILVEFNRRYSHEDGQGPIRTQ